MLMQRVFGSLAWVGIFKDDKFLFQMLHVSSEGVGINKVLIIDVEELSDVVDRFGEAIRPCCFLVVTLVNDYF